MVLSVGGVVPIAGASSLSENAVPSLVPLSSCWRRSSLTQVKSALSYKTDVFNAFDATPKVPLYTDLTRGDTEVPGTTSTEAFLLS